MSVARALLRHWSGERHDATIRRMSAAPKRILREALALPETDRKRLAARLVASFDPPADDGWEEAWSAEIDRRMRDANADGDPGRPWSVVKRRIQVALRRAR